MLFGNVTEFGPQAHRFIRSLDKQYQIVALAETHVAEQNLARWGATLQADGWKLAATAAPPTLRSAAGTHGGEWILSRKALATTTFEGQRKSWLSTGVDMFVGFCLMILHLRSGNLVVIATYWLPGDGILGANTERVRSLSSFVMSLADPWVVLKQKR